jgi:hypothetical protein
MSWARLLKRVFDIDIERCPNCGGALKIIAAIEEPAVIAKILTPLKLAHPSPAALTGAEADMLALAWFREASHLVSFNGKCFDVPLLIRVRGTSRSSPQASPLGRYNFKVDPNKVPKFFEPRGR